MKNRIRNLWSRLVAVTSGLMGGRVLLFVAKQAKRYRQPGRYDAVFRFHSTR